MLELGVKLLLAYLLGTLLGSLMLGRLRGVDIRSMGSGNAGATNALRTQGKLFGFLVLLVDVAKGLFAVWWLPVGGVARRRRRSQLPRDWLTAGLRFRGDRGARLSRLVQLSRRQGRGDRGRAWLRRSIHGCSCPCS